jgi:aryl-alcohol dehydrogenase-like predicted oxidoreductase
MAEFVLGSVQLGLDYGAANRTGKPSHAAALALVRRAADSGIRIFDTARAYGDSEARLGEALSGRTITIVTKLSPLAEFSDGADPAAVVAAVEDSVSQSCAALRQSHLDCLLLHRASHRTQFAGAVWQRLLEYVRTGTIACLGVSVQSPAEVAAALTDPAVRHIQMPYNLIDWRWRRAGTVDLLRARSDVVVHARSAFLQGLLAAGDASIWPQIDGVDPQIVLDTIAALAADLGRDGAADLCLSYVRGQDFINGVVIGLETEAQLDRNLRLALTRPLDATEIALVEQRLPQLPEQLLNPALWPKKQTP